MELRLYCTKPSVSISLSCWLNQCKFIINITGTPFVITSTKHFAKFKIQVIPLIFFSRCHLPGCQPSCPGEGWAVLNMDIIWFVKMTSIVGWGMQITVKSHKRHGISNHWQFNCFHIQAHNKENIKASHYWPFVRKIHWGLLDSPERAYDVESVSISWCHHEGSSVWDKTWGTRASSLNQWVSARTT